MGFALVATFLFSGCEAGTTTTETATETTTEVSDSTKDDGIKVFKSIETFPYAGNDPHKEYFAWHTQKYGLSETLFRITADLEIEPWLAESITTEGTKSTIVLKDGICFSNGNPVTADMVKRNLERLVEVNNRFFYMEDWTYETADEKTLVIDTIVPYPTLKNDLISPEMAIIDLDNSTDLLYYPIAPDHL